MISLTVAKGMPVQIALDQEVRVRKVGQPIHGRVVQPVYAFDRLVIPIGTEVIGRITKIESLSGKKRTLAILNANFTPVHKIDVEFTALVFADGKHIPFHSVVTPGSGEVMQLVSAREKEKEKRSPVKDAAAQKIRQAKEQAKQEWRNAMQQVRQPGKIHRLERYAVGQLPVHPQYLPSRTLYLAELQEPLGFGSEELTAQAASSIGTPPPPGSLVHALLVTPLDSATTPKGAEVEAILSQPLFDGQRLILPPGSLVKGSVVQVQPAGRMKRNGQLRIVFRELIPPDGLERRVAASLEGLQPNRADDVKLDAEGGAAATSPRTRYLSTALSGGLAVVSATSHNDSDDVSATAGNSGNRIAGGAAAFKLAGIALGAFVHSQPLGIGMGAYGASRSVYAHFLARGRDVVFPKNMSMEIGFGSRGTTPAARPASNSSTKQ